jgi:ABC-type sugar transport system permease subunit
MSAEAPAAPTIIGKPANCQIQEQQFGYASAVAIAMFAVIFCLTFAYQRWSRRDAVEY